MSIIQLFATAIRVVGVYWLYLALMQISFYGLATMHMETILVDGGAMYDIAQLAWSSVYVLVAILMIIFPVKLVYCFKLICSMRDCHKSHNKASFTDNGHSPYQER